MTLTPRNSFEPLCHRADFLVADIGLRAQEGRDFVRGLTSQGSKRPFVIVIASDSQVAPNEPGIDAYLPKPVDPDVLLAMLRRLRSFAASC